jgi:hypothetical protein
MKTTLLQKQEAMIKRVGYRLRDCGQYFTFTINEDKRAFTKGVENGKAIWNGKCTKCHKALNLQEKNIALFESIYGKAKMNLTKSTFDTLFDIEDNKK